MTKEEKFRRGGTEQFSPFQLGSRQITDREQSTLNEVLKGLSLPKRKVK